MAQHSFQVPLPTIQKTKNLRRNLRFFVLARSKGLEPSISAVTGRRFNQLSYDRKMRTIILAENTEYVLVPLLNTARTYFANNPE